MGASPCPSSPARPHEPSRRRARQSSAGAGSPRLHFHPPSRHAMLIVPDGAQVARQSCRSTRVKREAGPGRGKSRARLRRCPRNGRREAAVHDATVPGRAWEGGPPGGNAARKPGDRPDGVRTGGAGRVRPGVTALSQPSSVLLRNPGRCTGCMRRTERTIRCISNPASLTAPRSS